MTPGEADRSSELEPHIDVARRQFLQGIERKGFKLEPNIEEVVVMLNLCGLKTSWSCEGHLETEGTDLEVPWEDLVKKEGKVIGGPWVTIDINDGDQEYAYDQEQRLVFEKKCFEVEEQLIRLLDEFYSDRYATADARLYFWGEGSYTLTNQGGSMLQNPRELSRTTRAEKLEEYRKEMSEFAAFLRGRLVREENQNDEHRPDKLEDVPLDKSSFHDHANAISASSWLATTVFREILRPGVYHTAIEQPARLPKWRRDLILKGGSVSLRGLIYIIDTDRLEELFGPGAVKSRAFIESLVATHRSRLQTSSDLKN